MHLVVWNIFAMIGMAVTLLLLFAGAWVWAVVIRNVLLSARSSAALTIPTISATLHELQLLRSEMTHAVHPVNDEIN
jgi:hypothetical protein